MSRRTQVLTVVCLCAISAVIGFTPYSPSKDWTYYIEAARPQAWPTCAYRFASYSSSCDKVDMWSAAGVNQEWQLLDAGDGNFYLKSSCGYFLSYTGDCTNVIVDLWPQAGINQKFRFVIGDNTQFEYYIEAVGRGSCSNKYLSFPETCTTNAPDKIDMWYATGFAQRFRLHPVRSTLPAVHNVGSDFSCPDPYVWQPMAATNYLIQCTGGGIKIGSSASLEPESALFSYIGDSLGGVPNSWAAAEAFDSRWAPENYELSSTENFLFFADTQPDSLHRIGWVLSTSGDKPGAWTKYSASYLNLGMAVGGDIDVNVFSDTDGKTYLSWKTDDNNVGSKYTRLWLQEVSFANQTVTQIGSPKVIMDSTGLWWVDSWIDGGSLIEGPELVKRNGMYYLFFASGKFCQDTYMEGVARSLNVWGPYEKMGSPLLSNGIVGLAKSSQGVLTKLVGPGHATVVNLRASPSSAEVKAEPHTANNPKALVVSGDQWRIIWHASIGENCNRYAFVSRLVFGSDGWPYVDF